MKPKNIKPIPTYPIKATSAKTAIETVRPASKPVTKAHFEFLLIFALATFQNVAKFKELFLCRFFYLKNVTLVRLCRNGIGNKKRIEKVN